MESKTRIKGNVHYVGVNDRNKHRFEAMWPLPYGVSYNSYLIDDEMVLSKSSHIKNAMKIFRNATKRINQFTGL